MDRTRVFRRIAFVAALLLSVGCASHPRERVAVLGLGSAQSRAEAKADPYGDFTMAERSSAFVMKSVASRLKWAGYDVVSCDGEAPADARFTVLGWAHRSDGNLDGSFILAIGNVQFAGNLVIIDGADTILDRNYESSSAVILPSIVAMLCLKDPYELSGMNAAALSALAIEMSDEAVKTIDGKRREPSRQPGRSAESTDSIQDRR